MSLEGRGGLLNVAIFYQNQSLPQSESAQRGSDVKTEDNLKPKRPVRVPAQSSLGRSVTGPKWNPEINMPRSSANEKDD